MRRESELRQQAQEAIKGLIVRLSGWPDQSGTYWILLMY
ncbi:bacteriocin immunity protein [Lactiplantibacillus plantarum]|nr:bacteriocin immunity protein [Lactiplantibacillus plantarum]